MRNYNITFIIAVIILSIAIWSLLYSQKNVPRAVDIKNVLSSFEMIKKKNRIDVIILNSPTVYYMGALKEMGFEYELISLYAKDIGVDLNLTVVYTVAEALQKSREGEGDITVASISVTADREKEFKFGPKYLSVKEQIVCSKKLYAKDKFPSSKKDLVGLNIVIGEDTSYEESLKDIEQGIKSFGFNTTSNYSTEQLLLQVDSGIIDCSVSDSNLFMINQRYFPELRSAIDLNQNKDLAWILREKDDSLKDDLTIWLDRYKKDGKMKKLREFYYAYLDDFNYYDVMVFNKRLKNRLPKYEKYFKEAGEMYAIAWELLAAQSYQESHWDPYAKSHTGVRGMMMLTKPTAEQMGIKDRIDAKKSIFGGAKYLSSLEKRFSDDITGIDRWLLALAAYNVGMGHIHDAQVLARRLDKNPYIWSDIKEILPLLMQKKYYKTLKYGYARGNEPVKYIGAIQEYLNIIINNEK